MGRMGEFVALISGHWLGSDGAGQCRCRLRRQHFAKLSFGPASAVKPNIGLIAPAVSTTAGRDRLLTLHKGHWARLWPELPLPEL